MDLDKKFKCDRCGKPFKLKSILLLHSMKCEVNQEQNNQNQSKAEDQREDIKSAKRLKASRKEKKVTCDKCNKSFNKKTILDIHSWNCGKTNEIKCKICDTVFKSPVVVQVHFNQYHREKKFKCDKCDKHFAFKSLMKKHIQVCDGIKKEPIERKPKETLKDIEYKIITYENSGKVYQCKKCQKNFSDTGLVLQHIYHIHKEKKHKCKTCQKLFFFKSGLQNHIQRCNYKKREPKLRLT